MAEFETTSCPVCRGQKSTEFLDAPDRFASNLTASLSILRCESCSMVYLNPRPTEEESKQYYQHEEYLPFSSTQQGKSVTGLAYRLVRRINLRWKRRLIEHYWRKGKAKGAGRLLDVGCGTGEFLEAVRRGGWQVEGVERDENASAWARESLGIPVETGSVDTLQTTSGLFDVITLWHVLEHLYDPGAAVRKIRDLLANDGYVLIALPNVGGLDSRVYGANWIALDTPRHVNHFSPTTLTRLLTEAGFVPLARRQLPFDAFFNTIMSEELAAKRGKSSVLVWPFRVIRASVVSLISLFGGSRLFSARYGATMVFLFEKA